MDSEVGTTLAENDIGRSGAPLRALAWGGGCFLAIGLAILLYFVGGALFESVRIRGWNEHAAMLEHVSLETSRGTDQTTYAVKARYRYRVDGRDYIGERVGLHGGYDNIGSWHQRTVDRLNAARAASRQINIYVHPDNPGRSIIDPRPRLEILAFSSLFGLVFSGVGAAMLRVRWRSRRNERRGVPGGVRTDVRDDSSLALHTVSLAGRTLPASGRPLRNQLIFVGAWFAFIGLAVLLAFSDPSKISNLTALLWILGLFGAIGVVILISALRTLLRERRSAPSCATFGTGDEERLDGSCLIGGEELDEVNFECTLTLRERRWRNSKRQTRTISEETIERRASATAGEARLAVQFEMPFELLARCRAVPGRAGPAVVLDAHARLETAAHHT